MDDSRVSKILSGEEGWRKDESEGKVGWAELIAYDSILKEDQRGTVGCGAE